MKMNSLRKIFAFTSAFLVLAGTVSCGKDINESSVEESSAVVSEESSEAVSSESEAPAEEKAEEAEGSEPEQIEDTKKEKTIFDKAAGDYTFTSGAGGWLTSLTLNSDGTFSGGYHDSEYGLTGEGYDASVYVSSFSGTFSEPVQIDEYSYSIKLSSLEYANEVGTEEIVDGVRYIYSEVYGLTESEEFIIYTPDLPEDSYPEEFASWKICFEGERYAIYNKGNKCTFFNVKRHYSFMPDFEEGETYRWMVEPIVEADEIYVGDCGSVLEEDSLYANYLDQKTAYIGKDGKYGFIDYEGNIVVPPSYDSFNGSRNTSLGLDKFQAVFDSSTGDTMFVYTSEEGEVSTSFEKGLYGVAGIGGIDRSYIWDENENVLKDYSFNEAVQSTMSAFVVQKKKDGVISDRFTLARYDGPVIDREYEFVDFYIENMGDVYSYCAFSDDAMKWDIYDQYGKMIASGLETFDINYFNCFFWSPVSNDSSDHSLWERVDKVKAPFLPGYGCIAAKKDGKCGYLDMNGNELIPFGTFEDVRPVHYGRAWVKKDGKWGVIAINSGI